MRIRPDNRGPKVVSSSPEVTPLPNSKISSKAVVWSKAERTASVKKGDFPMVGITREKFIFFTERREEGVSPESPDRI